MLDIEVRWQILWFIIGYLDDFGFAPSIQEMADGCYMSKSTISKHLDILVATGYISRVPFQPRSICILKFPPSRRGD